MTSIPQFVFPGQTIEGAVLTSGGFQFVLSGGETISTVIDSGGIQLAGGSQAGFIESGGVLSSAHSRVPPRSSAQSNRVSRSDSRARRFSDNETVTDSSLAVVA
jgi:autotransporter passenger strand-loop-strand repeat protein